MKQKTDNETSVPATTTAAPAVSLIGDAGRSYSVLCQDASTIRDVMSENIGDGGIRPYSLDRIALPTGGGQRWTVPTISGEESVDAIEGIIVHWQDVRVYYATEYDGSQQPPDCTSEDCRVGVGNPGGTCRECAFSQFGSAIKNGKPARGQACSECRRLFVIQPDNLLPLLITLPPTSLGEARKFFQRLASRAIPYYGVEARIALKRDKNATGIEYAKATISASAVLTGEQVEAVRALREMYEPILQTVNIVPGDGVE